MREKFVFSNSYIQSIDGVDYLRLNEENYYKTGLAAGSLFVKSEYKIIKLLKNPIMRTILWMLYFKYEKRIQGVRVPQEYKDELLGCAEATGVSHEYLLLLNLIYEIRGCSGFAFFNPDGSLIVGHNTDTPKLLAKLALRYMKPLVKEVIIPGKNRFAVVALPLMMGAINGFNDKGIALSSHDSNAYARIVENNTSTSCLVRMVLEKAGSMDDVQKIAQENFAYYPGIMLVASRRERRLGILEAYPTDFGFTIREGSSCVFSANHYQSDKMRKYGEVKKGSLDRLFCLKDSLSGKSNLSVQEAIEILKDRRNGIQRDSTGYSIANLGTFQSFVFDVTEGCIYISNGKKPPVSLSGSFVKIKTDV